VSHEAALRAATPTDVAGLMRELRSAGFSAYAVGGAVRDVLAGRVPADWDLATDATPDQLRRIFPNAQYENRFGTVGIPTSSAVREVTTFRSDGPSSDARRPDSVTFLRAIEGDLARRDFTINAMAFGAAHDREGDPIESGALVDPHGGAQDLAAGLLRAVGDPAARFAEDALRMLRAARFVTRFSLALEPSTATAIKQGAHLAATLSGERIGAEVEGILAAESPARGIAALHELGLLAVIAPALNAAWTNELPALIGAVGAPGGVDTPDPLGRMAELLTPIEDDKVAEEILTAWRRPRAMIHAVSRIRRLDRLAARAEEGGCDAPALRIAAAAEHGDPHDAARQLRRRIATKRAHLPAAALLAHCEQADAAHTPSTPADLAIDGAQLLSVIGEAPGPWVKEVLDALLGEVARGNTPNEQKELLAAAERLRLGSGS